MTVFLGLIIPFIGTTLGAVCVFFVKNELKPLIQKSLLGFAAGVMVAASVWSLLIPAMEMSGAMGRACISSGCGWIHYRNPVFADSGPGYSTSAHRMRGGRRPGMQSEKINDADSCCNDS